MNMDPLQDEICRGCLNSERKLSNLYDSSLMDCFKLILQKTTVSLESIHLCFECVAILIKIKRFQERVKSSEYLWKSLNKKTFKSQTSLQRINLYNISSFQHTNPESCEIIQSCPIKNENPDLDEIDGDEFKQEIDELSVETDLLNEDVKREFFKDLSQKEIFTEVQLSTEEIQREREEIKISDAYINAMLKCELCVTTFTNNEDLKEHVSQKHAEKTKYNCAICKCTFNSAISFKYHTDRHKNRYQCLVCGTRFLYKRDVIKHFNLVHCHGLENVTYENGIQESLDVPSDVVKQDCLFSCDICEKSFRWKASLRKHMEGHRIASGQKRKPFCEPCKLYFATTANLKKHVRMSSKHQIQLKLRKLKDSNEDKTDVIKEIRTTINSARETYSCSQCDKKFQWHGNLMRHMNSHRAKASGELVCMPCNRSFSSIATYQQHMKISKKHVTENDFKYMCSDCGKRFADKTRLKDHIDWEHLKNFKHTCCDCQKAFKTRTSLYLHKQVVHQRDTSEHLCDTCGKHFPNHSKLRIHIRAVHSSVAAYKCTSCGAKFAWHSCLSRHIRRLHKKHV